MGWNYIKHNCEKCNINKDIRIDVHNKLLRAGKKWKCNSCTASEHLKLINTKHGKYGTPTYVSWQKMKDRCNNPNHKYYRLYGGRGISFDKKWETFEGFLQDMGEMPKKGFSLDRIDNDDGYHKMNCRWIPRNEQQKNRRCCKK
jgi:hypothetical protein